MRTGKSNRSARRGCFARKVVSGAGLTIPRKDASSRMYSVARREEGVCHVSAVPVASAEERAHGGAVLSRRLRPKQRDAVVGGVVLQDKRQCAIGIA